MIEVNTIPTTIWGKRIVCGTARWNLCAKNPSLSDVDNNNARRRRFSQSSNNNQPRVIAQSESRGGEEACWKTWNRRRTRERARRKLKQTGTYMHHNAFRSFTAGSFHLRPTTSCFYCRYDVMVFRRYCQCSLGPPIPYQKKQNDTKCRGQ